MTNRPSIQVSLAPDFLKDIKRLRKKYPHIQEDIQPLIDQLIDGETPAIKSKQRVIPSTKCECLTAMLNAAKAGATA